MSIYLKLNKARIQFHSLKLEKTGHNKFAGYKYFELGDFLIPALKVFQENQLCAFISFGAEMAIMSIVDTDTNEQMQITSPMSTAALKGCHEVQNLGAVQTYLRRYLWVAALEIVEHDAVDASAGKEESAVKRIDVEAEKEALGQINSAEELAEAWKKVAARCKEVGDTVAHGAIKSFVTQRIESIKKGE